MFHSNKKPNTTKTKPAEGKGVQKPENDRQALPAWASEGGHQAS